MMRPIAQRLIDDRSAIKSRKEKYKCSCNGRRGSNLVANLISHGNSFSCSRDRLVTFLHLLAKGSAKG